MKMEQRGWFQTYLCFSEKALFEVKASGLQTSLNTSG